MNKSTQILTRWNLSKIESELNTLKQNLETHLSEVTKAQQQLFDRLLGEENWKKARDRFNKVHSLF